MNDENLIPNNKRSPKEVRENGRKGGIASGRSRREKANLRKLAQMVLDNTYSDKKTGKEFTGSELFVTGLAANLSNPDGKNWGKAVDILVSLTGAKYTDEDLAMLRAQAALIQAKAELLTAADTTTLDKLDEILKEMRDNAGTQSKTE